MDTPCAYEDLLAGNGAGNFGNQEPNGAGQLDREKPKEDKIPYAIETKGKQKEHRKTFEELEGRYEEKTGC